MRLEFLVILLAVAAAGLWLLRSVRATACGSGCSACPHKTCPSARGALLARKPADRFRR